jgi:hypothetical protein
MVRGLVNVLFDQRAADSYVRAGFGDLSEDMSTTTFVFLLLLSFGNEGTLANIVPGTGCGTQARNLQNAKKQKDQNTIVKF